MTRWATRRGEHLGTEVFAGARVIVAGWGATGRSSTRVLADLGADVIVLNGTDITDDLPAGVCAIVDTDPQELAQRASKYSTDLLIASPGWPPHHPVLASWAGPIWSDIELAWHICDPATRWIVVTGTNGKTTTIGMVGSILAAAGRNYRVVGNIGVPIVQAVWEARDNPLDNLAVELSSFQLHNIHSIAPVSAVVLNLADDHIDWHGSFEAYSAAKAKVYEGVRAACIYNVNVQATRVMVENADVTEGARAVGFTLGTPGLSELGIVEDSLVDRAFIPNRRTHGQVFADASTLAHLAGPGGLAPHIVANALAAAGLTLADDVTHEEVQRGLAQFRGERHRMEHVGDVDGVYFVNDSKATNAHAAAASLDAMDEERTVWILGGLAKGAKLDGLVEKYVGKLRAAVIIGVDPEPFSGAIARHAPQIECEIIDSGHDEIMTVAVETARRLAQPGDTVLLAPAGASMDQFKNYETRGDAFVTAVDRLKAERS